MRAYFNMPTSEFVAQLRSIAINAGARPQVIDQLDAISEDAFDADDMEQARKEGHEEGEKDGQVWQFEECRDVLESLRTRDPQNIGLVDEQLDQILELIDSVAP